VMSWFPNVEHQTEDDIPPPSLDLPAMTILASKSAFSSQETVFWSSERLPWLVRSPA
jgi:hypothetical protein